MNNEIFQTIMAVTFFLLFHEKLKGQNNSICISNQALHVGKKEDVEKRKMTKSFCVYVHAGFLLRHILTICYEIPVLKVAFNNLT